MPFLKLEAALLWLGVALAARLPAVGALPPQPSNNCQRKCGDVDIPYPFGIGPDSPDHCAMPGFNLSCHPDTGNSVPKPFIGNVEVLGISLQRAQARVMNEISSYCYNTTSQAMDQPSTYMDFTDWPYRLSNTDNMFTVVGCNTLAYIGDEDNVGMYTSACAAMCRGDLSSLTSGSCSGIGCCQTAIPTGLQYYRVRFDDIGFNTTKIYNLSRCSYGVLMDSSNFSFFSSYVTTSEFNKTYGGRAPLVLDWAIGTEKCEEAVKKTESYACVSSNSECINSPNGPGYICNCSKGFEGNPYLQDPELGCTDINECLQPNICPEKCVETTGGYICIRKHRSLILGIAIGLSVGFGILLLILSGLFLIRRWRLGIKKQLRRKYFRKNKGLLMEQLLSSDENARESTKIFCLEELEKATNNFDPTRILGSGGHGMVYKGILSDQRVVAIKKSKVIQEAEINQFINEVVILSQINHRNIVKLFGCCLETEVPLLVYDFVPNGSLFRIVHANPSTEFSLSWDNCLRIAMEAAGALCYLHSAASVSVFHRDVKSSNILLDGNYTAKVSDFGASRLIPIDQTYVVTNIQGTFGYFDPEYYQTGQLNEKSDVYSFGVILIELLLRKEPIFTDEFGITQNLSNYFLCQIKARPVTEVVAAQTLEEATEDEINTVASLAEQCLRLRGEERPTMKQVEMALQFLRNKAFESCNVAPETSDEIQPLLSSKLIARRQALSVDAGNKPNLASLSCYNLEREFMSSASLPR